MSKVFVPAVRPRGGRAKAHGWIKPGTEPGFPGLTASLYFSPGPAAAETELLEFYVTACQDEDLPVERNPAYVHAPGGAFVYDARYLVEHHAAGALEEARLNLEALIEAYRWWKKNRVRMLIAFFCAAGQNRSVTSAIAFAFSAVADSEMAPARRRSAGADPPWTIAAESTAFRGRATYDGSKESLMQFAMRLVREIRPQAFHKRSDKPLFDKIGDAVWKDQLRSLRALLLRGAGDDRKVEEFLDLDQLREKLADLLEEEAEAAIDWSRLWVGHPGNKHMLRMLDAVLRVRLYGARWEGQTWLDWKLPPRLEPAREEEEDEEEEEESARVAREEGAKKRRAGARAPDEGDDAIIPL